MGSDFACCSVLWFLLASQNVRHRSKSTRIKLGLPWWLGGKESSGQYGRCGFSSWVGMIPWKKMQPTPALLPRKYHAQRSLGGYSPAWSCIIIFNDWTLGFTFIGTIPPLTDISFRLSLKFCCYKQSFIKHPSAYIFSHGWYLSE